MSIIERQDKQRCRVMFVETLGEARKKKLAASNARSVLEVGQCIKWKCSSECFQWTLVKRSKGARRMPRRGQAKKDVASCEKPWGGARTL
jgi:hypothetical protein